MDFSAFGEVPSYDLIAVRPTQTIDTWGLPSGSSVTRYTRAQGCWGPARTLSGMVLMADDTEIEDHGAADSPHPNLVFEGRTDVFLT